MKRPKSIFHFLQFHISHFTLDPRFLKIIQLLDLIVVFGQHHFAMKLLPAQTLSHLGRVYESSSTSVLKDFLAFFWEECKTFQLSTKPSKPIDLLIMQLGIVILVYVFQKGSSQQETFKQQNQELEFHKSPLLACSKVNLVDVVMVSTFCLPRRIKFDPARLEHLREYVTCRENTSHFI